MRRLRKDKAMKQNSPIPRILETLHGDPDAIRSLAGAIARNDVEAIRHVLSARGVNLSGQEAGAVVRAARGEGGSTTVLATT
jgi:hypothetical protein